MQVKEKYTHLIKKTAKSLGFDYCGIAQSEPLDEDARRLELWLSKGMHGGMKYMENYFDMRIDPSKLVPNAKSVITVLKNYYPEQLINTEYKISKYAYGEDYHTVIRDKLNSLISTMQLEIGSFAGRGFVDSAPVLERTWAKKSGLGWIGKNGNLITPKAGSFFFIATLITDLDLLYDNPFANDFCGTCNKCVESCPTEAILPDKTINGSKCISYFTIELKEEIIPEEQKGKFNNWMFGCDICQDVCPWNRFSQPNKEDAFKPIPEILNISALEWEKYSEEGFKKVFKKSAIKRAKLKGIQRNIRFIKDS